MIEGLESDAALGALLEALSVSGLGCTVVVDRGDRLERAYANAPCAEMFGVELEEARDLSPMDHLTPEERARLGGLRQSLGKGNRGTLNLETSIVRKDGAVVPVEVGLVYVPIGEARATFVFMRDLSPLRESEERFRRVAEASPDSITVFSEGRYIYANPVALRHLGLSSQAELETFDPLSKVPLERREEVFAYAARNERGERLPPLEHRFAKPDGSTTVLETSLSHTKLGGKRALISYTRDITERVEMQAELMKQDRLASVGMLAAGVAHELNNPLTALGIQARGLVEDADRHGFNDEVRGALQQMDDAACRMQAIISDLLFIARPSEQPKSYVDVEQVVHSTVALLRAGIEDCPELRIELESLPPIRAYPSKLGQVILNVLRNAVQAVEDASSPDIVLHGQVGDGAIEISISDNGVGIPADLVPRVAQPFLTTKPHGTGLGLWISQALMTQHGGTLYVKSIESQGTTVTLELPLAGESD